MFFDALVRYEVTLWNAVDQELTESGLVSLGQLHALRIIDRYTGQARVQEISTDIGITVGAASKLVDRLERDGLAVRRPNPTNRRSSLIDLTPGGRAALTSGVQVMSTVLDRAVGDEDAQQLASILDRLQTRLDHQTAAA